MKKIITIILTLTLGVTLNAQTTYWVPFATNLPNVATATFAQSRMAEMPREDAAKYVANVAPVILPSASAAAPAPFFTNDFSNASDWTTNDAINGGLQDWVIGTTGPSGSFSQPMGAIASTTTTNGFAMYDSDALGTSATNQQDATITYNGTVDCSAYAFVNINFESSHRKFHDSVFVEVSNDAWLSFERIEVHASQAVNDASDNPEFVSVNISNVAGNQASVSFRFHYEGEWDYAWMVDDVTFTETPDNLIVTSQEVMGGWWVGYQISGGLGQNYTMNPFTQIAANPYSFESVIENAGVAAQNVTMYVEVTEQATGSLAFSGSSNTIALAATEQDTFVATSTFSPTNVGFYTIAMWGEGDSAITDTTALATVANDYIYGKDQNSATGAWRVSRGTGGFEVGSSYDLYANENLYSIDAHIADYSVVGTKVYAVLYEADVTGGDPIFLDQSDDYTIGAADIDGWINIPFLTNQSLTSGVRYIIAIGGYLHPTDTAGVNVSGAGDASVDHLFDKDDHYANGAATWFSIGDVPMIRMNFDPATAWSPSALSEVKTIFNMYPNPTNGVFVIELNGKAKYDVTINNVLGQVVYEASTVSVKTIIDLSNFDKGVYIVELKDGDTTYTEKVIVE